jgi:hypothetical protein
MREVEAGYDEDPRSGEAGFASRRPLIAAIAEFQV